MTNTNKTVVKMVFGSHLYGLDHADSDTDYKGIMLPTAREIILQQADFHISKSTGKENSKNGAGDVDEEYFSLNKFVNLAMKGETVAIDMLHAPANKIIEAHPIWAELVSLRGIFYTKNMKAYVGYVRKQAAKYGVKGSRLAVLEEAIRVIKHELSLSPTALLYLVEAALPLGEHSLFVKKYNERSGPQEFYEICGRKFQMSNTLEYVLTQLERIYAGYGARAQAAKDNNNIDWKAISHALRAGYQARAIYATGTFSYPLPETEYLMAVKMGKIDWLSDAQPTLESLVDEIDVIADKSDLPDKVDSKFWIDWLYQKHLQIVEGTV